MENGKECTSSTAEFLEITQNEKESKSVFTKQPEVYTMHDEGVYT
jgi:hypothetical protein